MSKNITLEEAREILGDEAIGYTDDSLQELLDNFNRIARLTVRNFKVLKNGRLDELDLVI